MESATFEKHQFSSASVTWRPATAADLPALRVLHFPVEVATGHATNIPEETSTRTIFVAERAGKVVGGAMAEQAIVVTILGLFEKEVTESAYRGGLIPAIVQVAGEDGCRLVEIRFRNDVHFDLQTELDPKAQ